MSKITVTTAEELGAQYRRERQNRLDLLQTIADRCDELIAELQLAGLWGIETIASLLEGDRPLDDLPFGERLLLANLRLLDLRNAIELFAYDPEAKHSNE